MKPHLPDEDSSRGTLADVRVLELASTGAAPYCGMLLADMGAEVTRIDRPGGRREFVAAHSIVDRSKRSAVIDLGRQQGRELLLELLSAADVLLEGFRPGVMERLGLGPRECLLRNPRLVYGRITGYGRTAPRSSYPGHDLGFTALSGALSLIGRADDPPVPAANLIADMGGGGMLLALGVTAALLHARRTGTGQVVDTTMTAGAASLLSVVLGLRAGGQWSDRREVNLLDGGAPHYTTYTCSDGRHVAVAALEEPFFQALMKAMSLETDGACRTDRTRWTWLHTRLAQKFATRTRDHWIRALPAEACVTPVLTVAEAAAAPDSPYLIEPNGTLQPVPVPDFSHTPSPTPRRAPKTGQDTRHVLRSYGIAARRIDELAASGAIVTSATEETT